MLARRATYAPVTIVRARQQYVDGLTVAQIVATAATNTGTFYKWLAGDVPGMSLPAIPRRRNARRKMPRKSVRVALVRTLWRAAEQQVAEIEQHLAGAGKRSADRERDSRSLAVLVRTLRELAAMDHKDGGGAAKLEAGAADDDVRDIDEFRRDLARHMEAIIAQRTGRVAGEPDLP
jgi:hypothetical protein